MDVPVSRPQLIIHAPTETARPGRGFYQREEDSLHVPVITDEPRSVFSWLESHWVRLEFDRLGQLIFVIVKLPRRRWSLDKHLPQPEDPRPADIRFLDFRSAMADPAVKSDPERRHLCLEFDAEASGDCYSLAEFVIVQIDAGLKLARLWVTEIVNDIAGKQIAAFRGRYFPRDI